MKNIEDLHVWTDVTDLGDVVHIFVHIDEEEGVDIEGLKFTIGGYPFYPVIDEMYEAEKGNRVYRLTTKDEDTL